MGPNEIVFGVGSSPLRRYPTQRGIFALYTAYMPSTASRVLVQLRERYPQIGPEEVTRGRLPVGLGCDGHQVRGVVGATALPGGTGQRRTEGRDQPGVGIGGNQGPRDRPRATRSWKNPRQPAPSSAEVTSTPRTSPSPFTRLRSADEPAPAGRPRGPSWSTHPRPGTWRGPGPAAGSGSRATCSSSSRA
jgi:hypothetical protein